MGAEVGVPVICIDGPGGSGKGVLSASLAEAFGWGLLDSGALYRALGAMALERGVPLTDGAMLGQMAEDASMTLAGERLRVDGVDWSARVRTQEVAEAASRVAKHREVRAALLPKQRQMACAPGLVADGRDMGTVVFPQAALKIYLDASSEVRAERRYKQLKNKALDVSLRDVLAAVRKRDARDARRADSPMQPAADAIRMDTTHLGVEAVLQEALKLARARGLGVCG